MGLMDRLTGMFQKRGTAEAVDAGEIAGVKELLIQKIRQSELFADLPAENMEQMFQKMEPVAMRAGELVLREGDEGDYYYLLAKGTAKVLRRMSGSEQPQVVAELNEPTGFGEEALISNAKRNASVVMNTAGVVMRLSKDNFNDFVKEPLITWLAPAEAQEDVSKGARWLDVREGAEARESRLHGALNIPLRELRTRLAELDKKIKWICYCGNGRMSSTAAFLLRQRGYDVGVLRGGVQGLKHAGLA